MSDTQISVIIFKVQIQTHYHLQTTLLKRKLCTVSSPPCYISENTKLKSQSLHSLTKGNTCEVCVFARGDEKAS